MRFPSFRLLGRQAESRRTDAAQRSTIAKLVADGDALRDLGRWRSAADAYGRALAHGCERADIHVQHAHALKEAGSLDEALDAYDRALAEAPGNMEISLHRTHLLKKMGHPAALAAFRELALTDRSEATAADLARLEAVFDPPLPITAPPTAPAATPGLPSLAAARLTKTPPPGLYPRRRAVRFVAKIADGAAAPRLSVQVDDQPLWSGEIDCVERDGERLIDSVFSFAEPEAATRVRRVRVDALTTGIDPPRALLELPYADRFRGSYSIGSRKPSGVREGTAWFIDHEHLTVAPLLRGETTEGEPIVLFIQNCRPEAGGWRIDFETTSDETLRIYPMWSAVELDAYGIEGGSAASLSRPVSGRHPPVGQISKIADGQVEGWVLLPGLLDERLIVDVMVEGVLVGCGWADQARQDLADAFGGAGAHGFRVSLPTHVPDGSSITARVRGCSSDFSTSFAPPSLPGVLIAAARRSLPAAPPESDVDLRRVSTIAVVLCGPSSFDIEAAQMLDKSPVYRIDPEAEGFSTRLEVLLSGVEADRVLLLSGSVDWDAQALAPLEVALATSGAAAAIPILCPIRSANCPGGPDRWGWSLEFLREQTVLRPSPASPWLERAAREQAFMDIPAGDWTEAALIDRKLWLEGSVNPTDVVAEDVDARLGARLLTGGGRRLVLATQASVNVLAPLPEGPIRLKAGSAYGLARDMRRAPLLREGVAARPPVLALLVTTTQTDALEGDVLVARELAAGISAAAPHLDVRLVAREDDGGADLAGADAVIILRHDSDPRRFRNLSQNCQVIFWVRNWFDEFLADEMWRRSDQVWLSSERECERFLRTTGLPARLLRIGTNFEVFESAQAEADLECDVCFTGSYWGAHREISVCLVPEIIDGSVRIFGSGWDSVPELSEAAQGAVSYTLMPSIYASAKLVVDDANHVTVESGSVNSRVYDAIAAGALPITNGVLGAREVFGDLLPTYSDAQSLTREVRRWLSDEPARQARVAELRDIVRSRHDFRHRAEDVVRFLSEERATPYIALTGYGQDRPYPRGLRPRSLEGLMSAFMRAGWRIDWLPESEWSGDAALRADLRLHVGAAPPPPARDGQIALSWLLSEADALSPRLAARETAVYMTGAAQQGIGLLVPATHILEWPTGTSSWQGIVDHLTNSL